MEESSEKASRGSLLARALSSGVICVRYPSWRSRRAPFERPVCASDVGAGLEVPVGRCEREVQEGESAGQPESRAMAIEEGNDIQYERRGASRGESVLGEATWLSTISSTLFRTFIFSTFWLPANSIFGCVPYTSLIGIDRVRRRRRE